MTDVVHVITGLGTGGAETMLVQLSVALQARGLSQHVVGITSDEAVAGDLRVNNVGLTILGAQSFASLSGAALKLARTVNALRPRIIQGWMYHGNLGASLCHHICRNARSRSLFWNLRASNMDEGRYGRLIRWSGLVSKFVDVVIANSEAGVEFHRSRGFRPKRFMVIDNGINIKKFHPDAAIYRQVRAELGISEDAIVVIHVARVDPMKDHANFLAAMARVPTVIGILVGSGTQDLSLPPNVRALGLRHDVERLLAAADVIASTSAFGEGFSNAIAEGMSAGLIPIATDVGDSRRIIGDVGTVVPPRDPDAFSQAIAAVASLPKDERSRRGVLARERILSHFALDLAIDRYFQLYAATIRANES
jgi:glycosyltransferase involved in cell wall biosynthesis